MRTLTPVIALRSATLSLASTIKWTWLPSTAKWQSRMPSRRRAVRKAWRNTLYVRLRRKLTVPGFTRMVTCTGWLELSAGR